MKSLAKPLTYIFFTSLSFSQALFGIGKWYSPDPVPTPLLPETEEQEANVVDFYNKGNILCYKGKYYINNTFPIYEDAIVKDFAKICLQKNLLSQQEFDLIKFVSDEFFYEDNFFIPNKEIKSCAYAFRKFILCIKYHIQHVCKDYQLVRELTRLYYDTQDMRTFYDLKSLMELLVDVNFMEDIWIYMHTEPLMVFDNFYQTNNLQNFPKIIRREDPLVFISYFDMCEACEEFIEKFSHFHSVPQRTYQKNGLRPCSYKTLVGSFNPWLDSRDFSDFRNKDLLKVPLEFPSSILLNQDPALEQIATKNQQLNIPTPPTSNPQSTVAPFPGNKRQRTTEQTPLQIPQTQQPSLLPTPKTQPSNVPVTLPAKSGDRPVVVDANQRPIKKAKTSSPASSETNIIPKSPASAPANTSAINVSANNDDFDEDEALAILRNIEQAEKQNSQPQKIQIVRVKGSPAFQGTQKSSLLPSPKTQPASVPVSLPAKPEAKTVVTNSKQQPIKKANSFQPTSSSSNIDPKSSTSVPSNVSTSTLNVSTNNEDSEEDEALLKIIDQLEQLHLQTKQIQDSGKEPSTTNNKGI